MKHGVDAAAELFQLVELRQLPDDDFVTSGLTLLRLVPGEVVVRSLEQQILAG